VDRVRKVYNEVEIAAPSAMSQRSADTWITTKVKTALLDVEGLEIFDSTRVKVVTERGVVYLMGLLTRDEAELVTETVRRVAGVQRVVRLFEYAD
jgi:osmotically-inducible protein OsmY